MEQEKVRCVKTDAKGKTEVRFLSKSITSNPQFMKKYGWRIEEVAKSEPVKQEVVPVIEAKQEPKIEEVKAEEPSQDQPIESAEKQPIKRRRRKTNEA